MGGKLNFISTKTAMGGKLDFISTKTAMGGYCMPGARLELALLTELDLKSSAAANYATRALNFVTKINLDKIDGGLGENRTPV